MSEEQKPLTLADLYPRGVLETFEQSRQSARERVDQWVAEGRITEEQGNDIKETWIGG